MKIRTQLFAGFVVFVVLLIVISMLVVGMDRQAAILSQQEETANGIALEIGELGYLSNDYILYREPVQADRWNAKYASIAADIGNLSVVSPEEQAIVNNLVSNLKNTKSVFDDIRASPAQVEGAGTGFIQLSWSRMAVQNQGMIFDAGRLARLLGSQAEGLMQARTLLIFALMGALSGFLLVSYLLFYRRTLKSIGNLQEGAKIIGSGNLGFEIEEKGDDEIAELAHSFNRMTSDLHQVTASKADLEREITERIRTEEALREAQKRTSAILESIADTFYSLDDQWRFTTVNPAAEKAPFGRPSGELLGRVIWELYPGLVGTRIHQHYLDAAAGNTPERYEAQSPLNDRWYEVFMQGRNGGVDVYMRDITERKLAEDALRESKERLSTLYESMTEGVAIHDLVKDRDGKAVDYRIVEVNPAFEDITGIPRGRAEGALGSDLYGAGEAPFLRVYAKVAETGESYEFDTDWVPMGKSFHISVFSPAPGRFATVFQDITERRNAEQALRESEERYRGVVQNTTAVILRIDPDGIVRFANQRALEFFGYRPEELIGKQAVGTIVPERETNGRDLAAMVGDIAKNPERFHSNANENMQKGGRRVWMEWTNSGIYDSKGRLKEFLSVGIDATERKHLEDRLRETAENYATLFDTTSDGIWINDLDGIIVEVNDAYCGMSGYSRDELLGMPITTLEAVESPGEVSDHLWRIVKTSGHERFETRHRRKDGTYTDVDITAVYLPREGGRIAIFARDITERKSAEMALKWLAQLPRQNPNPVLRVASDCSPLYVNPAGKVWLASLESEAGKALPGVIREIASEALAKGGVISREVTDSQGRTSLVTAIQPGDERYVNIYGNDITGLRKAEMELREAGHYLENLINYASAPIIVWDKEYCITRFNHASERMTGRSADSVLGRPLDILFPEKNRLQAMDLIKRTQTGERLEVVEIPILNIDGRIRTVLWNSATLYEADGRTVRSTIAQGQDITERKIAEESLKKYAANLERSNKELEQFAYVASHDLREPLRMVTSFSQLLKERYRGRMGVDADEFIDYIVDGGIRMDALVNDLLEFSRITSKAKPFEPTEMNTVVDEALRNLSFAIRESGVKIQSDTLPSVSVDRSQMVQVYQNLISNAIKFRAEHYPEIHIGAIRRGDEWVFSVSDNGIGIDPAYWERIFEIFKRLHTREQYPGTGIGLAICRRIVERHGGRIWVESEEGKGSTFFFSLPTVAGG